MIDKQSIRQAIRQQRAQLDASQQNEYAQQIKQHLDKICHAINFEKIGFYLAQEGEADPVFFIQQCAGQGKKLFAPISDFDTKSMDFYPYQLGEPLIKNKYNIPEPISENKTSAQADALDIVLLPLVAFDQQCHRMGRGAGFYDRTFAFRLKKKKPLLIGIAYEFQKVDAIPTESWDVPTDYIVTEKTIYKR